MGTRKSKLLCNPSNRIHILLFHFDVNRFVILNLKTIFSRAYNEKLPKEANVKSHKNDDKSFRGYDQVLILKNLKNNKIADIQLTRQDEESAESLIRKLQK